MKKPFKRHFRFYLKNNHKNIKKAGGSQPVGTNNLTTSKNIKTKRKKKGKKNGCSWFFYLSNLS